jgi:Ca2+-binding RTX toxin-like protein
VLQSLRFESRTDDPDESLRQISISVQDERGAAGASAPVYTTVGVDADESVHTVFGSARNEKLNGTHGDDQILGGAGNDAIAGKQGHDRLFGEAGNDNLQGGAGDDLLSGGAGHDILTGGAGADRFVFTGQSQTDVITDFDVFQDEIILEGVTYKGQEVHSLADAAAAAHSFGPVTIYNFDNGATLWVVENPISVT